MIAFLAMPEHLQHWAYGVRHLLSSEGNIIIMPNCTRKMDKDSLYLKYADHCKLAGEACVPRDDFRYASDIIAGRDEKLLDALDSVYIKCGPDNFRYPSS